MMHYPRYERYDVGPVYVTLAAPRGSQTGFPTVSYYYPPTRSFSLLFCSLWQEGYSPNDTDQLGNTATHLAAANGHEVSQPPHSFPLNNTRATRMTVLMGSGLAVDASLEVLIKGEGFDNRLNG